MLAYNYVDMMYACSLFVTHTDIFLRGVDTHNGTSEVVFSQHIPPSACVGCRRVHGTHVPGWGCGRLALPAVPSGQSK